MARQGAHDGGSYLKGLPDLVASGEGGAIASCGLRLLADELLLPAAVLKRSAIETNRRWMREFLQKTGVLLCPHGKTTMSPELFAMQLEDGAWGLTAATAHHVRLYVGMGVKRILMANQLVGRANIEAVASIIAERPDVEFYCLVDSIPGVVQLSEGMRRCAPGRRVSVLLEVGAPGQRTGARDLEAVLEIASCCAANRDAVRLSGVETFEGVFTAMADPDAAVCGLLDFLGEAAREIDRRGLFDSDEVMITAGGTAFFDLAAGAIRDPRLSRPVLQVIRSGCYLTHDSSLYERSFTRILERSGHLGALGRFEPALEVWGHVQSRPEATRLIASVGKRDIGSDAGFPVPVWVFSPGRDASPRSCQGEASVAALYDQHACLDVPADFKAEVGDLIGFGVSHPCTTFDKWKAIVVVDDDYRVIDMVSTAF
jgi:D-serine dehydratase